MARSEESPLRRSCRIVKRSAQLQDKIQGTYRGIGFVGVDILDQESHLQLLTFVVHKILPDLRL